MFTPRVRWLVSNCPALVSLVTLIRRVFPFIHGKWNFCLQGHSLHTGKWHFYGCCPAGCGLHNVKISVCVSRHLNCCLNDQAQFVWFTSTIGVPSSVKVDICCSRKTKKIIRGWTELCHPRNQKKNKKVSPPPNIFIQRPYMSLRTIFLGN